MQSKDVKFTVYFLRASYSGSDIEFKIVTVVNIDQMNRIHSKMGSVAPSVRALELI